jgi:hypothetical protein
MIKRAIVDIDNTLWHFCDALYDQLNQINGRFPTPDSWTHWDLWEGYCTKDDFYNAVNAVHDNQHSESFLPYPEAQDFLAGLRANGFHITIASHRSPVYRRQTKEWLNMHGLIHDELHLSYNKTELFNASTDVVVDDAPQVLKKAVESGALGTGLLFPWNRDYAHNGVRLFGNLTEVLGYILKR